MQPLNPAMIKVWRIKAALWWAFLVVGALVFDLVRWIGGAEGIPWPGVLTGLAVVLMALHLVYLPPLRYRFWSYQLRSEELHLVRGILTRVHTVVPLRRIQHLDVTHDLIEREFDLGRLVLHTAGARGASVELPGLRIEAAEALRDQLKHYILEDVL